jgi:hypothetical protein
MEEKEKVLKYGPWSQFFSLNSLLVRNFTLKINNWDD